MSKPNQYQRGYNDALRDANIVNMDARYAKGYRNRTPEELMKAARDGLAANGFEETEEYWLGYSHGVGYKQKEGGK